MKNEKLETTRWRYVSPKGKIFVNILYRPPDASIECFDWYENCIRNMDLDNRESILMGDFNCDWSKLVINNAASHNVRMSTLASTY